MRRSLAPHVRARWERQEHAARQMRCLALRQQAEALVDSLWLNVTAEPTAPAHFAARPVPADTALLQRAARAERQATGWHRLAIALAVGCAVLLLIR